MSFLNLLFGYWWQLLGGFIVVVLLIDLGLPFPKPEVLDVEPPSLPLLVSNEMEPGTIDKIINASVWPKDAAAPGMENGALNLSSAAAENTAMANAERKWKLVGVSTGESHPFAVVVLDEQVQKVSVGEQLPGGERLISVLPFGIEIERSGQYENVYLFQ